MQISLYQVDAFASNLFEGNPAAVCPLTEWLSDEVMQSIAAENNLSETAFFVPNGADYDLRWFTPGLEVDLCGHATLASAHVLFHHLNYQNKTINFHTRSGLLQVEHADGVYAMNFPADQLEKVAIPTAIVKGLGFTPKEIYRGRDDFMVVVDTQDIVEHLQPDFRALAQLEARGVIVTAPGNEVDFVSRGFFPATGVDEDPVTGSAHTTMTPYWAKKLNKPVLSARQISKRGGSLSCELSGDRVILKGQAITFLEGTINV